MIPVILAIIALIILLIFIFVRINNLEKAITELKTESVYWKELFEKTKKERDSLMKNRVVIKKINQYQYD